ncbi:MAG: AtzE family amidohydrolase [Alphaproteobacteria bacterium]|nr:AtzE family amidohydrolase [Alphaproteobacteria bacterium]MBV9825153.1 AtzE family amidohydrolase [Alphaproteobacteria bacterium]
MNTADLATADALAIAAAVRAREVTAVAVTEATLARIAQRDTVYNSFTTVTAERAMAQAKAVDAAVARGDDPGPLAGAPFAVKNLFDIAGMVTVAGSKIDRDLPPATSDATLVQRLAAAGAILIGALNMDEYAYGFTTENAHYGTTRNPLDPARIAGGSSGGSAAAVAGGLVPLSLGSDTNGSIRVPASLCGIFGLKPTYGRLGRGGARLFAASLDHVGPFARSARDLAAVYDAVQGPDPRDPACTQRVAEPASPVLAQGAAGLRIATLGGHFNASGDAADAVAAVAKALGANRTVEIPEAARARAAAFVVTPAEGANLHLADLKSRAADFDPGTRDRFLAGALIPATWIIQAQRFRAWYRAQVMQVFRDTDILLAPATPCSAPLIGQEAIEIAGEPVPMRPFLGVYTQPLSFIGLPIVAVPTRAPGRMPIGAQIIAAPWHEAEALRVASALERDGVAVASCADA